MVLKIALGTVQFGLDYGIANQRGRIPESEVFEILDYAEEQNINVLDTALGYGESQKILGEYAKQKETSFEIISKLTDLGKYDYEEVQKILEKSLDNLHVDSFYGYLVHRFDDYRKNEGIIDILDRLKGEKLIQKIGFSLYRCEDLEYLFARDINFDIVQIPYSIFDRRFEKYFARLKEKSIEVYVRSVFLQGLAFKDKEELSPLWGEAKKSLDLLRIITEKHNLPAYAICMNFPLLNNLIDKLIIGVDSLEQLKNNVESLRVNQQVKEIIRELDGLEVHDEDILLPYKWK